MSRRTERKHPGKLLPCVMLDVNTQIDFLDQNGAVPVLNREALIPTLRRMFAWAKRNQVPVVSAVDCHRRDEIRNTKFPMHCLDGSHGEEKVPFTLFGSYVKVEGDNTLAVPIDLFQKYQQVIFRKRTTDFFLNPKADRFITELPAREYIVAGLGVEGSIKALTLGLIARGKCVTVAIDACGYFDRSEAELAIRLIEAKGARLISVSDLALRKLARPIHYPHSGYGQISLRNGLYASIPRPHERNGHRRRIGDNGQGLGKQV